MRVLRSQTRRTAAAAENVVTPQKKVSRKPTNKKTPEASQAPKDPVKLPTPPPSTRKGKVTKPATEDESPQVEKETESKEQEKEADPAPQSPVDLTDETIPTLSPLPSNRKRKLPASPEAKKEATPKKQKKEASQEPADLTPSPSTRKRKLPARDASPKAKKETTPKKQEKEAAQASQEPVKLTPSPSTRKRKLPIEDKSPKTTPKKQKKEKAEKRECKFRTQPPKFFDRVLARALGETFYIIERLTCGTEDCPGEDFELVGSTGSTYTVNIGKRLSCSCPQHSLGFQQCKHIVFIMKKVLNAPDHLLYQQALISTELKSIFDSAPSFSAEPQEKPVQRRPIEGNCPICFFKLDEKKKASIVWCSASCGHNFHMQCLKICARPKSVTCPVCCSDWKGNKKLVTEINQDEYDATHRFVARHNIVGGEHETDGLLDAMSTQARWYKYGDPYKRYQGRK
ncbi:hypothetical protein FPOAC1_000276 [Fusarium poae]|uniref:hypothetical protein n=1 Tax=Fusarium poae TaxID=36050 RepID=UPI001CE883A1|nr:hypothetical protein FPOAC1_000276 [Fusarium poae]KAG8674311.1 hypothetical protein FPOAC1_000276 [Fusarium poae]